MAIIPFEPFRNIDKFFEEDWDFLPVVPFKGIKVPEADVYQTDKDVVVEMPLAGVRPEDVNISVEDNILIAKGKTKEEKEEKKKNYYKKEIKKGFFERLVTLPVEVKGEKASAKSENGMLKITLPKTKVKKLKRIQVKIKK